MLIINNYDLLRQSTLLPWPELVGPVTETGKRQTPPGRWAAKGFTDSHRAPLGTSRRCGPRPAPPSWLPQEFTCAAPRWAPEILDTLLAPCQGQSPGFESQLCSVQLCDLRQVS